MVSGTGITNNNGYVAWCFKAGGAAVANTDGTCSIATVSANVAGGFSIVKWILVLVAAVNDNCRTRIKLSS